MPEQTPEGPDPRQTPDQTPRGFGGPAVIIALACVAAVWAGGCVWSFEEQSKFAESKHFQTPWLLPLVIDGLAMAMAAVAFAAALDSRPAVAARLAVVASVAASAASNAAYAWARSDGDEATVALAVAVPVLANLAFEVLLAEVRRQVLRRRGVPAQVALPMPRLRQLALAPIATFVEWRTLSLAAADLGPRFEAALAAANRTPGRPDPRRTRRQRTPDQTPEQQTPALPGPDPQTPEQTPAPPDPVKESGPRVRPITSVRDRDAADLAKLRANYPDRTPSLNEVERFFDCGRSRAIRIRTLLLSQTPDDKEQAS